MDRVLRSLAHPCRREVLCFLDAEPVLTRDELASNLGSIDVFDNQMTVSDADISLHHTHLPKLADAGLIDADDEFWLVERGPNFDVVRDAVDAAMTTFS